MVNEPETFTNPTNNISTNNYKATTHVLDRQIDIKMITPVEILINPTKRVCSTTATTAQDEI